MTHNLSCRVLRFKALHFLNVLFIITLLVSPFILNAAEYNTHILNQSPTVLKIRFSFEKPDLNMLDGKMQARYKKSANIIDVRGASVPLVTELVSFSGKKVQLNIISEKKESISLNNYLISDPGNSSIEYLSIKYLGIYRNIPLYAVSLVPVQYDPVKHILTWTNELVLEMRNTDKEPLINIPKISARKNEAIELSVLNGKEPYYNPSSGPSHSEKLDIEKTMAQPDILSAAIVYKITVEETGLYKITYQDLQEAEFPLADLQIQNLALYNKNVEIPVYIDGLNDGEFNEGDYIEFWAEKNEKTFFKDYPDVYSDPFSDKNVYWLIEKNTPGLRYIEESGALIENNPAQFLRPTRYRESIHFEKDEQWERFGHDPENIDKPAYTYDHWFWGGRISSVSSRNYDFYLAHPYEIETGASVFVEAMFRGVSIYNSKTNPIEGHKVEVWLNDYKVGETVPTDKWQGQKMKKISNQTGLTRSSVVHGDNTLRVVMDQQGKTDIVRLNWFNISYLRRYRADNGFIKFKLQENLFSDSRVKQFEIDGFNSKNIEVYKLGLSKIVSSKTDLYEDDSGFESYRISFQDQVFDPDIEYIALTKDARKKPLAIQKYIPWKVDLPDLLLNNTTNSADLLIISSTIFDQETDRLTALKEQMGYTVETIDVQQIYDTFNFGIKSPLAIKAFLKYVYNNWDQSKKLKYVLLIGDASYDTKERLSTSNDLIPSILFSTNLYGAAPSDLQYAMMDDDDMIPDISIGRIPATSVEELENYIDKIEVYQNNPEIASWKNKTLFVSGKDISSSDKERVTDKPIFRIQNSRLIRYKLPQDLFAYRLNTIKNESIPENEIDPDQGGTRELIDFFDGGLAFVNFFGHGGGGIWADNVLFDLDDVDNLRNEGLYPFIASMTCFTGAFENPARLGLAEKFLFAENKGAIAVLASSSVGWKYNDFAIEWALYDYLWDDNFTFGDAVDMMKISYMANSQYYTEEGIIGTPGWHNQGNSPLWSSMVNQYNLLGDPTLKMVKPLADLKISLSDNTPTVGEQIQISIKAPDQIINGIGEIEISDNENFKYLEEDFILSSGMYMMDFNIPDSIEGSVLKIKSYISNGQTDANGHINISIGRSIISSVNILPQNPEIVDELTFEVVANSFNPIAHMELRKFRNEDGASTQLTLVMEQINDSLFRSTEPLNWTLKSGVSYFEIYIRDVLGNESIYDLNRIVLYDNRPDLVLDNKSIQYSGNDRLLLTFKVQNNSSVALDSVGITCFNSNQQTSPFYEGMADFPANQQKSINIPYQMDSLVRQQFFNIQIDPLNKIVEKSEENNAHSVTLTTDHIFIDRQLGTSLDGITHSQIPVFNQWQFLIAPENITASSVIAFKQHNIMENFQPDIQKDLKFIALENALDSSAIEIQVKNSISNFTANVSASIDTNVYSPLELANAHFYLFDTFLGMWSKRESVKTGNQISAEINRNGLYAVFVSDDINQPYIELSSNGRTLSPAYENNLGTNPSISILLQDENGIDFNNSFSISIDGEPVDENQLIFPDSILNPNSIAIIARPQLEKGTHEIEVQAADLNNNTANVKINFQAVDSEDFIVYGNYPNPFAEETIISYRNNGSNLFDLKTRIYSVSGRLVRKKRLPPPDIDDDLLLGPRYHELAWDGSDDDNNRVANGVYFVVVEAIYKDNSGKKTSIKRKLKVAKLK